MVVENVVSDDHVWVGFLCRGVFEKSNEIGVKKVIFGSKKVILGHSRSLLGQKSYFKSFLRHFRLFHLFFALI